ncbi:hypothetical protein DRQ25_13000 [Candidatus Fermentibacteria bacterium]|nr:MAG: hypothetical protein DRQ25_13000 [Candidatus Fermentibacteria bacterium]
MTKPVLLIAREVGGLPCPFCSRSALIIEYLNNHLKEPIDVIFSDEFDNRIDAIQQYLIETYGSPDIPTPLLYYEGSVVIGVATIQHYFGILTSLITGEAYR